MFPIENATVNKTDSDAHETDQMKIIITVIYILTAVTALTGNTLAICILSAVADLCMALFCIPFTYSDVVFGCWLFGKFLCPTVSFFQVVGVGVSIFTNVAFAMNRLFAVIRPLQHKLMTRRRFKILLSIWVLAAFFASPQLMFRRQHTMSGNSSVEWTVCMEVWPKNYLRNAYTICLLAATYLIPLITLTVTYSLIAVALSKRQRPGESADEKDEKLKRRIIKMSVVIVSAFLFCWAPLYTLLAISHLSPDKLGGTVSFENFFIPAHWLAMAHSSVNPVVYCFLCQGFRKDLKKLFRRCFSLKKSYNRSVIRLNSENTQLTPTK